MGKEKAFVTNDIIKSGALDCLVELFYLKEYCNALIWFFIFVIFFQNQCNIIFSAKFSLFLKKKSGTVLEFFSSVNLIYLAKCFWLKFSKFLIWKEFLKNRTNESGCRQVIFNICIYFVMAHDLHAKNMQGGETKWNEVLWNKTSVGANINLLIGGVHWVH
jgi:hypothetical protein